MLWMKTAWLSPLLQCTSELVTRPSLNFYFRNVGLLSRSNWEHSIQLNDVACSTAAQLKTSLASHTKCTQSVVWTLIDQVGRDHLEVIQSIPCPVGLPALRNLPCQLLKISKAGDSPPLGSLTMNALPTLFTQNFFSCWSGLSGPHFHYGFIQYMMNTIHDECHH